MRIGCGPMSAQTRAWAQAVRSTHSPIGTMRPVSSASGMNSVGEMMPRSGWRQRTSASTPTIWPLGTSIWGWYSRYSSLFCKARRKPTSSLTWLMICMVSDELYSLALFLPQFLAWYMAVSAYLSRELQSSPSSG